MNLPVEFTSYMQGLLGAEYSQYLDSLNHESYHGLRTNRLKISSKEYEEISPFEIKKIPFIDNGYIYDSNNNPAKDVFYHAGLYYLQEPSAMLPANRLPIDEGDTVLDLCAAPGGKATELAAKLNNTGLLYANDISASRALALVKNLELFGAENIYVTAESPDNLALKLPGYFSKILCDVPCSGEGMFRKDSSLIKSWISNGPDYYQPIQRSIIDSAYEMLKPGGMIMYSTCTFNEKEDEDNIEYFLDKYSDMTLIDIEGYDGFSKGIKGFDKCVRVFPHKMMGEGHFLALMQKKNDEDSLNHKNEQVSNNQIIVKTIVEKKSKNTTKKTSYNRNTDKNNSDKKKNNSNKINSFKATNTDNNTNDKVVEYKLPALRDNGYREEIRYLRTGLLLGDNQSFAMTLSKNSYNNCLDMDYSDIRVIKYLKGETLFLEANEGVDKGTVLILVNGFPLGFAKSDGTNKLKNLYNKSWKME